MTEKPMTREQIIADVEDRLDSMTPQELAEAAMGIKEQAAYDRAEEMEASAT